ncbi:hypothetical protein BFJ69_g17360 [Fusarium oxysporum]|uniref:PD-(D/E)XK nuclease-like domain-containing protein n=1 Tax=Fusarium oxysporum TaxID=5507 RepID=A0A420M8G8_FUSOX|nr:hypothetical protein BFJ69_g17360 [Fusarium oxysporum]
MTLQYDRLGDSTLPQIPAALDKGGLRPSNRPTSLNRETKKYGGDVKKGDVQMASWQAAQWTCLASQAGDSIEKLPFLPGIIVQGHHWSFVATTRRGDETTLWASTPIGTTMTSLDVLQIMAGLSRLRRWAVEDFWPWYKDNVLKETQMV